MTDERICSFCRKTADKVRLLLDSGHGATICESCIARAVTFICCELPKEQEKMIQVVSQVPA